MLSLILLSACVSFITLGILFIQRIRPVKVRIPSFFLGEKSENRVSRIRQTPPKWWEIALVLMATLGTAFAFFAQRPPQQTGETSGEALVWFDPTYSHLSSLNTSAKAQEMTLDGLRDLNLNEYIFINLNFAKNQNGTVEPSYQFESVPAAQLSTHVQSLFKKPSALSQPLTPVLLIQEIKQRLERDSKQFNLYLVTDAQVETLRNLSPLADAFQSITVLRTPASETPKGARRIGVVPEELAKVWNKNTRGDDENYLPGTPQFVRLDVQLQSQIPPQARPSLSVETLSLTESEASGTSVPELSTFFGEEVDGGTSYRPKTPQPLLTTCTLAVAGPGELDGMSDIRAYAQYFKIPIRPLACRPTESSSSAQGRESFDPWKFRRASLWVVPVNEFVASDLFQRQEYWVPEGFAPETDALVYIADTRLQGFNDFLEQALIQLEKNQPALPLPLLPLPPSDLRFPWHLFQKNTNGTNSSQKTTVARQIEKDNVALRAADGTPLALTLSHTPTVVYLRTGGAAPNGELGRWGQWAKLWNGLKTQLEQRSPLMTRIQINNPQNWAQWNEQLISDKLPPLRYQVDPLTLRGQLNTERGSVVPAIPGLFIRERDDHLVLIEPPATERQGGLLTQAEVEQLFPSRGLGAVNARQNSPREASASQYAGAALAIISLIALWVLQRRATAQLPAATNAATMAVALLIAMSVQPRAFAQAERSPPFDSRLLMSPERRSASPTHPFRIAWCDATIPQEVVQRYSALQKLLANRGTIELPKKLTAGACRVGGAEMWWTSSLDALQASPVAQHIRSGGVIIAEGIALKEIPEWMVASADASIGLVWESPKRRGMLYRSFYLLSSFDGCTPEKTLMLTLRKKINAQAPMAIVTPARFLTNGSEGGDCFFTDDDYRTRSFVNMMYALLTTDYKEDQMQLPEILNRVRNLGLEP